MRTSLVSGNRSADPQITRVISKQYRAGNPSAAHPPQQPPLPLQTQQSPSPYLFQPAGGDQEPARTTRPLAWPDLSSISCEQLLGRFTHNLCINTATRTDSPVWARVSHHLPGLPTDHGAVRCDPERMKTKPRPAVYGQA